MEKITTKQLLDIAVEIVGLADRCHRAGLIDDWQATISVENDDNYTFEVRINPYNSKEVRWKAEANLFVVRQAPEETEEDDPMEAAQSMMEHLAGLIEAARAEIRKGMAELQDKLDLLNA